MKKHNVFLFTKLGPMKRLSLAALCDTQKVVSLHKHLPFAEAGKLPDEYPPSAEAWFYVPKDPSQAAMLQAARSVPHLTIMWVVAVNREMVIVPVGLGIANVNQRIVHVSGPDVFTGAASAPA